MDTYLFEAIKTYIECRFEINNATDLAARLCDDFVDKIEEAVYNEESSSESSESSKSCESSEECTVIPVDTYVNMFKDIKIDNCYTIHTNSTNSTDIHTDNTNNIMFLDTETSAGGSDRRLLQLSYIIVNLEKLAIVKAANYYINYTGEISDVTKSICKNITPEVLANGVPVQLALEQFITDVKHVDMIVGHNVLFDIETLKIEMQLTDKYDEYWTVYSEVDTYCTIANYKSIVCKKNNNDTICAPSLSDVYTFATGRNISNEHDSFYDTVHLAIAFLIIDNHYNDPANDITNVVKDLIIKSDECYRGVTVLQLREICKVNGIKGCSNKPRKWLIEQLISHNITP